MITPVVQQENRSGEKKHSCQGSSRGQSLDRPPISARGRALQNLYVAPYYVPASQAMEEEKWQNRHTFSPAGPCPPQTLQTIRHPALSCYDHCAIIRAPLTPGPALPLSHAVCRSCSGSPMSSEAQGHSCFFFSTSSPHCAIPTVSKC